jgi:hypothetical protein
MGLPVIDGTTPDGAMFIDCVVTDPALEHAFPSTSPPAMLPAVLTQAMVGAALMSPPQVSTYFASWFFAPVS